MFFGRSSRAWRSKLSPPERLHMLWAISRQLSRKTRRTIVCFVFHMTSFARARAAVRVTRPKTGRWRICLRSLTPWICKLNIKITWNASGSSRFTLSTLNRLAVNCWLFSLSDFEEEFFNSSFLNLTIFWFLSSSLKVNWTFLHLCVK